MLPTSPPARPVPPAAAEPVPAPRTDAMGALCPPSRNSLPSALAAAEPALVDVGAAACKAVSDARTMHAAPSDAGTHEGGRCRRAIRRIHGGRHCRDSRYHGSRWRRRRGGSAVRQG